MVQERMQELRRSFRMADLDPHQANMLLTRDVMQELAQHEQQLRNSLLPCMVPGELQWVPGKQSAQL